MGLEWSHGKRRPTARDPHGDVPALPAPSVQSAPTHDPLTGRFVKGNGAYRLRQIKQRSKGIATLDPKHVPSWMRPYVEEGVRVAGELAGRFPDDPAIAPLIGGAVDAWVVYRALLSQGLGNDTTPGDPECLKEARGWFREHRAAIATISGMVAELPKDPAPDALPPGFAWSDDDGGKR